MASCRKLCEDILERNKCAIESGDFSSLEKSEIEKIDAAQSILEAKARFNAGGGVLPDKEMFRLLRIVLR